MIKGSILSNHLKTALLFGFSECCLCRSYLIYVDDVTICFFFSFFGGMKIICDYLSLEISGYLLVQEKYNIQILFLDCYTLKEEAVQPSKIQVTIFHSTWHNSQQAWKFISTTERNSGLTFCKRSS